MCIASLDHFRDAPKGYHPLDVFPACKSEISFGVRFPIGTLMCNTHTPYTRVRNTITGKMDAIALDFCIEMEKHGIICVPIPTNESEWDSNTGPGDLSSLRSTPHRRQAWEQLADIHL